MTLITLGVIATGSIVFNVYFLATKDKALELIRTEVEGLKYNETKLEDKLGALKLENDNLKKTSRKNLTNLPSVSEDATNLENQLAEQNYLPDFNEASVELAAISLKEELTNFKERNKNLSDQLDKLKEVINNLNIKLESFESDKILLEGEISRLKSNRQPKIQRGEEVSLKSDELGRGNMQELMEEIAEIEKTNKELNERHNTTLVKMKGLEFSLIQSGEEVSKLRSEVEKNLFESCRYKTELDALLASNQDLERQLSGEQSKVTQPLTGDPSLAGTSLKAEEPVEKSDGNEPVTVIKTTTPEFDSMVKNLIGDKNAAKTSTDHPQNLNLPIKFPAKIERSLFDYFNKVFMNCAKDVNSDPAEVIYLKDCASAFAADPVSQGSLLEGLKKFFFLVLDDLAATKIDATRFNEKLKLPRDNFPEDKIFSEQETYLSQRLNHYYQTYYGDPSESNLNRLEKFFNGFKVNSLMYRLVPSAKGMFNRHMEMLLIKGIFKDDYGSTLLALEKLNLSGVTLNSFEDFNHLLERHLEPISSDSGDYNFETKIDCFRENCVNFFRLSDKKIYEVLVKKLPVEIKPYPFPKLKLSKFDGVQVILNSYRESYGALSLRFSKFHHIVKLFSTDFENLKAISLLKIDSSFDGLNKALSYLHEYCFYGNEFHLEVIILYLSAPPKKLRKPLFEILHLSSDFIEERKNPTPDDLGKGYLIRLVENHLLFPNLKKISKFQMQPLRV